MVIEDKQAAISSMTDVMSRFTSYVGKRLPTDVHEKLADLRSKETHPLAKAVYESMKENQEAADRLDRPSRQDTGVIQYFINAGAKFPLLGELEDILRNATREATIKGPLRNIEGAECKDLGMPETLWVNKVNEFGPLNISIDTRGNNLIEQNKSRFNEKKEADT